MSFEEIIVQRLADKGFSFDTKEELYAFCSSRCRIVFTPDEQNILFVDDKIEICKWRDEISFKDKGDSFVGQFHRIFY